MLELVKNDPSYWEFIRALKNTAAARANSLSQHIIAPEEHRRYMESYGSRYYVCVENGIPLGYVGTNAQDYISIAVIATARGRGIGKYMLSTFRGKIKGSKARAIVRITNSASVRLFESCGFGAQYYIFEDHPDE